MATNLTAKQVRGKLWLALILFLGGMGFIGWISGDDFIGLIWMILGLIAFLFVFVVVSMFIFQRASTLGFLELIPAEAVWSAVTGQQFGVHQINPRLQFLAKKFNGTFTVALDVVEGQTESGKYKAVAFSTTPDQSAQLTPLIEVVFQLPAAIPGTLVLAKIGEAVSFGNGEAELESISFNQQTVVKATSKKLAFQVLAPDVMDWYLRTPQVPPLLLQGDKGMMVFTTFPTVTACQPIIEHILHMIMASGAVVSTEADHVQLS